MTKTITLPMQINSTRTTDLRLDVCTFARYVADPTKDLADAPSAWLHAGLIAYCKDTGDVQATPRGEDLLASIEHIPDDPAPEALPVIKCVACDGKGKRPLFTSFYVCDACGGSGEAKPLIGCSATRSPPPVVECSNTSLRLTPSNSVEYLTWLGMCDDRVDAFKPAIKAMLFNAVHASLDVWRVDGLPEVGRFAEVEIANGERLRGTVSMVGTETTVLRLEGPDAAPKIYAKQTYWYTWADSICPVERRVRWRYVDAPET